MSNNRKKRKKKKANLRLQDVIVNTIMENKQISLVAAIVAVVVVIIIIATHSPNKPSTKEIIDLNISGNTASTVSDTVNLQNNETINVETTNTEASGTDYTNSDTEISSSYTDSSIINSPVIDSNNNSVNYAGSSDYTAEQNDNTTNETSNLVIDGQDINITLEDGETSIIVNSPTGDTTSSSNTDNSTSITPDATNDSSASDNNDDSFTFELPFVPADELN